jgi:uncharacterized protein (DUF1697 family)
MTRYIAFLRAVNVGGHTVKMEALRPMFEELDLTGVETFIASGNVIFETPLQDAQALEAQIQAKLRAALGYEVATFLRSDREMAAIAAYRPFSEPKLAAAAALNVAFLSGAPSEQSFQKLMSLITEIDDFHMHQREIYWLCKKKQSESTFSNAVLEKTLARQSTLRGINTIRKLTEKYPPAA